MSGEEKQGITPMGEHITGATFDCMELVREQLAPLLDRVYAICDKNDIPCFLAVCVKRTEEQVVKRVVALLPGARTPQNFRSMLKLEKDPKFGREVFELHMAKYADAPLSAPRPAVLTDAPKPEA